MCPRRQQFKDGKILNVFIIKLDRHICPVSLQLRRFAGDFDCFCRSSHLELSIHARGGIRGDGDVLRLKRFETGRLGSYVIRVGYQVRDAVIAVGIRRGFVGGAFSRRCHRNLRIRHGGAGRIGNRAENTSVNCLAGGWGRPEANEEGE